MFSLAHWSVNRMFPQITGFSKKLLACRVHGGNLATPIKHI